MSHNITHLLKTRRFAPLFVTQFLGAMNDNLFKNAMAILILFRLVSDQESGQLMVTLASKFEGEDLDSSFPTPVQRAQALLSLATHLYQARRGEPHLTRVSARLNQLLTQGEDPLLKRLLRHAEPDSIRGIEAQYGRGIDPEFERITIMLCNMRRACAVVISDPGHLKTDAA